MFLLTFWLWGLPWLAGDEKFMIWATGTVKLKTREIPKSEDYLLINVSNDLLLIDKSDEFGIPVGNQAITDRNKLGRLFQVLNQQKPGVRYILLDIRFDQGSQYDSILNAELKLRDDVIISYHLNESNSPVYPVFGEVNRGLSDYVIANIFEGVYKFQLYFQDSLKLTPLKMYEEIQGESSDHWGPFVRFKDWTTINHFILNYRLLQKDIYNQEVGFNPVNLGELLLLPDEDVSKFLKDKFIVIGDFYENDMHETLFELTSGPLILLNSFLSLEYRDTRITFFFFFILSLFYLFLSYIVIYPEDLIEKYIRKRFGKIKWVANLTSFFIYLAFLILCSIIIYFLFNIHINVFFLALYLFIIEKLSNFLYKRSIRKKVKA